MVREQRRLQERGRRATPATLRAMAALVALLLAASSLAQIAHFLLVPHAICEHHGELIELGSEPAHASEHRAQPERAGHGTSASVSSEEATSHDHCEVLASAQRQIVLPIANVIALVPAIASSSSELTATATTRRSLPTLSVAPKTSPPCRGAVA